MVVKIQNLPEKVQEDIQTIKNLISINIRDLQNAVEENALDRINMYSKHLRKSCKKLTDLYMVVEWVDEKHDQDSR